MFVDPSFIKSLRRLRDVPSEEAVRVMELLIEGAFREASAHQSSAMGRTLAVASAQSLGAEHPATILARLVWVRALLQTGDSSAACDEVGKLWACRQGIASEELRAKLVQLGLLAYREAGRFADALPLHEAFVASLEGAAADDRAAMWVMALRIHGESLFEVGRLEDARDKELQALPVARARLDEAHPERHRVLESLAATDMALGRFAEAAVWCEEAYEVRAARDGAEHEETVYTRESWANALIEAGELDAAAWHAAEVLDTIAKNGFGASWWRWPAFALAKIAARDETYRSAYDAALQRTLEHLEAAGFGVASAERVDRYDAMASLAWMLVEAKAVEDATRVYELAKSSLARDQEASEVLAEARRAGEVVTRGWAMIEAVTMGAALGAPPELH